MQFSKILLVVLLLPFLTQASDLAKEQRWREQVVEDLFDGEAISLNDGENEFLGLITSAELAKPEAIVVLHGIGVHPDWPQVVNPLRVGLAQMGWTTLSIQLPVLSNEAAPEQYEALIADAGPRISEATDYLKNRGAQGIYIVAHSMGSQMAAYYLANSQASYSGFVAIGMNRGNAQYLGEIKLPVLDLYGSEDLPGVLESAIRRAEASAGNTLYTQQIIEGADHFFNDKEDALLGAVSGWLTQVQN